MCATTTIAAGNCAKEVSIVDMMSRTWGEDVECAPIAHVQYVDEILTGVKNKLCILDVSTQHEKILMPCKTHLFEAPVRLLGKLPGSMGDSRNAVPGLYIIQELSSDFPSKSELI